MKLTGRRCQCSGCREYFNSDSAFDRHRTGPYTSERRCLTVSEMENDGFRKNGGGWWVFGKSPKHWEAA